MHHMVYWVVWPSWLGRLDWQLHIEMAICPSLLRIWYYLSIQSRIMLELNYMLSYGSAAPSLHLLWRFKLLDFLLPFHVGSFSYSHFLCFDKCFSYNTNLYSIFCFDYREDMSLNRPLNHLLHRITRCLW